VTCSTWPGRYPKSQSTAIPATGRTRSPPLATEQALTSWSAFC
jgi:hypothetical protein